MTEWEMAKHNKGVMQMSDGATDCCIGIARDER